MATRDVELGRLSVPDGPAPSGYPGIVLIPDVWGLGEHARALTERLAGQGFAVLGIDLYRRLGSVRIDDPGAWMRELSDPEVLSDVEAGVAMLSSLPETGDHGTGVIGFCMGGMYALMAGCGVAGVGAVVPFYGILSHEHGLLHAEGGLDPAKKPRQPLDAARQLACPLLGFFGGRDAFVPVTDVRELETRLAATEQPTEIVVYPEAGHAFVNDTRPDAYREREAADAWARMETFLRRHLGRADGAA